MGELIKLEGTGAIMPVEECVDAAHEDKDSIRTLDEVALANNKDVSPIHTLGEEETRTPIEIALAVDKDGKTTAKKLYAWLELNESHYSRWVTTNILENPFAEEGIDYSPSMAKSRKGVMGRPSADYKLTAAFAKKLAVQEHTERGEQARIYFLMCEKAAVQLAKERHKLELERAKGVGARKSLTDVILQSGENERMKGHAFPTYTELAYKTALGKNSRQLRDELGLSKSDPLRDYLSAEQLEAVKSAEDLIASLVAMGFQYDRVKEVLNEAEMLKQSA